MKPQNLFKSPNKDGRKKRSLRYIFSWPYRMGKRFANQVGLVAIHIIDAGYDLVRYIRYSSSIHYSSHDRKKLEASLFFYCHKIEKALSLLVVKPLFGLGYIEKTLNLVEQWVHLTGDFDAVVFRVRIQLWLVIKTMLVVNSRNPTLRSMRALSNSLLKTHDQTLI